MAGKSKDGRQRVWSGIVYPESAPDNWKEILDEEHFEWCCSPLHEFDVNPTGEVKKAHWHVVFNFEGLKSYDQVTDLLKLVNGSAPQRCHSLTGQIRYFAHLDNPSKYQYDPAEIEGHGGFDVAFYLKPTTSQRYTLIKEMMDYIRESGITEFQDLLDYAAVERFNDWFPCLCDNCAYVIGNYIKSQRYRFERGD